MTRHKKQIGPQKFWFLVLLSLLAGLFMGWKWTKPVQKSEKVTLPMIEKVEPYYIIINVWTGEVWGTDTISRKEFEALKVSLPWIKDDIDHYMLSESHFLRSPREKKDGKTIQKKWFGVDFEHIVDIKTFPRWIDWHGLLKKTTIIKHHRIRYPAKGGNAIRLLLSPKKEAFIWFSTIRSGFK